MALFREVLLLLSVIVPVIFSVEQVQCDGDSYCPDNNTCCKNSAGSWACCPSSGATCCSDGIHCCPQQHPVCNLRAMSCQDSVGNSVAVLVKGAVSSVPSSTVDVPLLATVDAINTVQCDGDSYCSDGSTCCRTLDGSWGCCPAASATCCADRTHCCPYNHPVCEQSTGACKDSVGNRVPQLLKMPSMKRSQTVMDPLIVNKINSMQTTWRAAVNDRFHGMSKDAFKSLLGTFPSTYHPSTNNLLNTRTGPMRTNVPKEFDARVEWPSCPTIGSIRDQGRCGSCWAFGAAEAISDRFCILRNESVQLSTQGLVSCCDTCGMGCDGGDPYAAWNYAQQTGLVAEDTYPYELPGCNHPCGETVPTPACKNEKLSGRKYKLSSVYRVPSTVKDIQIEILNGGPVEAAFTVFEDFPHYQSGVYQHVVGDVLGGHAIKIIGWGTERGLDYWLIANSWNTNWGLRGFFKIKRGTNECYIENQVVGGIPAVSEMQELYSW
eukprot:GILJ01002413.1.p1 GENE.GILJ01002413.1~~GILJ01002413.1.p1  ORF type:complete len:493 (+),score=33.90 GILJ01002413.1:39-1517(+)